MTTSKPKLRTGTRMSLDEFLALGETDERMELIDGILYIMPTATIDHQFLMRWICRLIEDYLYGFQYPPAEVYTELVIIISQDAGRILIPDLSIFLRAEGDESDISASGNIPDIVIEILSTDRNSDLVRKRQIYAEAGVSEYWIFDPVNDTVLPLELHGGEYIQRSTLTAADTLTTALLPGLVIPLADIFNHRRRPPRDG